MVSLDRQDRETYEIDVTARAAAQYRERKSDAARSEQVTSQATHTQCTANKERIYGVPPDIEIRRSFVKLMPAPARCRCS